MLHAVIVKFMESPPLVRRCSQIFLVATCKIRRLILLGEISRFSKEADTEALSALTAVKIAYRDV